MSVGVGDVGGEERTAVAAAVVVAVVVDGGVVRKETDPQVRQRGVARREREILAGDSEIVVVVEHAHDADDTTSSGLDD